MTVLNRIASSLGRNDETPNQLLAEYIAEASDVDAVKELVDNLSNKDKGIQSDCIKVLYETGERKPALIADYAPTFLTLLDHKNNRLVWGAMTALDALTLEKPDELAASLDQIIAAADKASVIAKDHAVRILIKFCSLDRYIGSAFPQLIGLMERCPTNQLPMYAEEALPIVREEAGRELFVKTLSRRLEEIDKDSKRKRVEKVIRKLTSK